MPLTRGKCWNKREQEPTKEGDQRNESWGKRVCVQCLIEGAFVFSVDLCVWVGI